MDENSTAASEWTDVWWDDPNHIDHVVNLGNILFQHSAYHHIIGIGQTPAYPIFAANLIAMTKGDTLPHAHVPMSGNIVEAFLYDPETPTIHITGTEQEGFQRLSEKLGDLCQHVKASEKIPVIFDGFMSGQTFASVGAMLHMYDLKHDTNTLNQAGFSCFLRDGIRSPAFINVHGQHASTPISFQKNISTIGKIPSTTMLYLVFPTDEERLVPKADRQSWGIDKALLPENPTSAVIKNKIAAAVAARYAPHG